MSLALWWVAEDYRLDGSGLVRPVIRGEYVHADAWSDLPRPNTIGQRDASGMHYAPMGRPELPTELAKVADEREESILAFVKRYGLLGQREALLGTRDSFTDKDLEQLGRSGDAQLARARAGDPVAWILAHARTVRLVLELGYGLRQHPDPSSLLATLEKLRTSDGVLRFTAGNRGAVVEHVSDGTGDVGDQARAIIKGAVNPNLTDIRLQLDDAPPDQTLMRVFEPTSLVACVYYLLAEGLQGGRIRQCAYERCRRLFLATDERMKYCPAPMDRAHGDRVSRCMNSDKVARSRARRRQEEARARRTAKKGGRR